MYEAKAAADEIPRLKMLFERERRGELAKIHSHFCHEPEPIQENHLTCCLGKRCSECPMLKALDAIKGTDEERDFAKAMTCVTHIISEGGDMANEGYILTVDDRMYWDNVYKSLSSQDEHDEVSTIEIKIYPACAHGDTCPECKDAKLEYDPGQDATREDPRLEPSCYCNGCWLYFPVDIARQTKRELAMKIARDLFTNGIGQIAKRLVMESDTKSDLGGWCESAVEDRIFSALLAYDLIEIPGD